MAFVGLLVPSVEVINNASFMVIFPLTFVANTFVPAQRTFPPYYEPLLSGIPSPLSPRRCGNCSGTSRRALPIPRSGRLRIP